MKLIRAVLSLLLLAPLLMAQQQHINRPPTHAEYSFLKQDSVILFQGDSVTGGGRQRNDPDTIHALGQDYAFVLAAELGSDIPDRNLKFINRGSGGDRVTDLAARWKDDTLALKPDVLSILVGINDMVGARGPLSAEEYESAYDKLLAETVAALPGTKIILGEPFLLAAGKHLADYKDEMAELKKRQAVVDRLGAKYHLPVVHYQEAFDSALSKAPAAYWSQDGVHPTSAGHGLMARVWLRVTTQAWGAS